jgi:hypothetical protein
MKNQEENSVGQYNPAAWLNKLLNELQESFIFDKGELDTQQMSGPFLARCESAAGTALAVTKLRRERQRIGFVPLSFTEYIEGLARVAKVSVSRISDWLGIVSFSELNSSSSPSVARLAKEIGMTLRELLVHVRIGFAAEFDSSPMALLVARRRRHGDSRSELDHCEDVLLDIESSYAPERKMKLDEIKSNLQSLYGEFNR